MTALSICLALLAALGNAGASVLQRRGAATEREGRHRGSWLAGLVHRSVWLWGAALLAVSGVLQALALATGPLAIVQPVMSTELMFTLMVGGLVFRRRPDARTKWAFAAMAVGLAVFLALADPGGGRATVPDDDWWWAGVAAGAFMAVAVVVAFQLPSAPRAAVLGTATATGFAVTAALLKDALGRLPDGIVAVFQGWQPYAAVAVGLGSFLLLQVTLRAGSLVASQPALTLGDALLSVVLGVALFEERVQLGWRIGFEALALAVLLAGCVQLARSPLVTGGEDQETW
ncbi:DMT family transporter [Streptomyces sp. LP05-1]|uniref:DMT family transporter n=1 Tax=Streptomyces pyxinae TaxID=2970734 RepID=A0ABT2CC79_9ACTN|nr:DMT family transporter [Streptomyces sp. LP05-1]MCS0634920.1 DMT family transporter [Streptomyces sp. LP05-1]